MAQPDTAIVRLALTGFYHDAQEAAKSLGAVLLEAARGQLTNTLEGGAIITGVSQSGANVQYALPNACTAYAAADIAGMLSRLLDLHEEVKDSLAADATDAAIYSAMRNHASLKAVRSFGCNFSGVRL